MNIYTVVSVSVVPSIRLHCQQRTITQTLRYTLGIALNDDDDIYLDKLQTRGVQKSILYM
jgi:hypothetical protein